MAVQNCRILCILRPRRLFANSKDGTSSGLASVAVLLISVRGVAPRVQTQQDMTTLELIGSLLGSHRLEAPIYPCVRKLSDPAMLADPDEGTNKSACLG